MFIVGLFFLLFILVYGLGFVMLIVNNGIVKFVFVDMYF